MARFDRILCPVDFDANSASALRIAAGLAEERGATLHLLHVVPMPPGPEVALPFGKMETAARTKLERLAVRKLDKRVNCEIHVAIGDPGLETLQMAKRLRANLIVMATHGRRGLRRLILGSVAERVVREAPCPVLSIKPSRAASSAKSKRAPAD
ncbi:MAG TPA: universal stress protein [Candidatus Binataceae bacterium]|nr:universal stress protein [Candidatus Binataceae bacterium]